MNKETVKAVKLARSYLFFSGTKELWPRIESIPYALVKGEALSLMAYGGIGKRLYSDIDILVDRKNVSYLENVCKELGFISSTQSREERIFCFSASHQIAPYTKQQGGTCISVDINFDVFWGEYKRKRIDIYNFLSDTIEICIYGNVIRTLPPLKTMIQLILHHYKEMNSIYHLAGHNSINQRVLSDVYFLWKKNQDIISLENLYKIALEYEIIPYVFYMLHFTNELYHDSELQRFVDAFETYEGKALLNCYGLTETERKIWKVDFHTRLATENLFELIKDDLTEADRIKLARNQHYFG